MRRLAVLVLALLLLTPPMPAAAVQLDAHACQVMAIWARDIIWAREMGADRDKVRAFIESQRIESPIFIVLGPMFKDLWATDAEKTAVMQMIYQDCVRRRGQYGTDT